MTQTGAIQNYFRFLSDFLPVSFCASAKGLRSIDSEKILRHCVSQKVIYGRAHHAGNIVRVISGYFRLPAYEMTFFFFQRENRISAKMAPQVSPTTRAETSPFRPNSALNRNIMGI